MSQNENVLSMFFDEEEISNGKTNEHFESEEVVEQQPELAGTIVNSHVEVSEAPVGDSLEIKEEAVEVKNSDEEEQSLFAQSDGQFSLFWEEPILSQPKEEEQPSKEEKEEKKISATSSGKKASSKVAASSTSKTVASVPKKKPQDIEIDSTWSIHYASHSFRVTDFINPMPASGKVNLEELRQEMEKEFFEMSKERTRWDYDETSKRLFPDVFGTTKGSF